MGEILKELLSSLPNILFTKLFMAATAVQMLFSSPEVRFIDNGITVTGSLTTIEMENFTELLATGSEISIEYELSISLNDTISGARKNMMASTVNTIAFGPLNKSYTVTKNCRSFVTIDKARALDSMRCYEIAVRLHQEESYQCADLYLEAHIDYPSKIAMDIPRDALWNHTVPSGKFQNVHTMRKK